MLNPHALQRRADFSKILFKNRSTSILFSMLLFALGIGGFVWYPRVSAVPMGITVPLQPLQQTLQKPLHWIRGDYTISALASYQMSARILGKKSYKASETGEIAPFDLALGWAEMSDSGVLEKLKITQSNRWFYVYWRDPPISPDQIMRSSANTHILPANANIAQKLHALEKDQVVSLKGYLVEVSRPDGFYWRSSLTREDTGNGSCEIFWVEDIITETSYLQAMR